jgi:hypothetical protein
MLQVHPETLRRWDRSGKLVAVRAGERGDRKYRLDDVLRFMANIAPVQYNGFEISLYSPGFEMFPDRFGSIAKFIVKKPGFVVGFAFAVPGLEMLATPNITENDLETMAVEKIKVAIDQGALKKLHEYTYEYHSSEFIQVNDPEWWKK